MKKFYWLPKLLKVEIKEEYFDSNTFTSTRPSFYWVGKEFYKWLWFEYEKEMKQNKDYFIEDNMVMISKSYPDKTYIWIEYSKFNKPNRAERRIRGRFKN